MFKRIRSWFKRKKKIVDSVARTGLTLTDSAVTLFTQVSLLQIGAEVKKNYTEIKEELFNEKLHIFLGQAKVLTEEEKNAFVALLDKDKDTFFKRLFTVIDRIDEKEKADMIGKLFVAMVKGKIKPEIFMQVVHMIDRSFVQDLQYLIETHSPKRIKEKGGIALFKRVDNPIFKTLSGVGLMTETVTLETKDGGRKPQFKYEPSHFGDVFTLYAY